MTIKFEEIQILKQIGEGSYGFVYKGKLNGKVVAIKEIKTSGNEKVKREKDILTDITHDHIIKIIGESTESPHSKTIYFILEYMDGGNLYNLVHDEEENYTFADVKIWFCQAAKALDYLHTRTPVIIHRDVKPGNMLLDRSRKTLKLCDFGSSREYETHMTEKAGTGIYMSPEVFYAKHYTSKCDIYSLNISLAETLTREHPCEQFRSEKLSDLVLIQKVHEKKLRPKITQTAVPCNDNIKKLMIKGWDTNDEKRPTAQEFERELSRQ